MVDVEFMTSLAVTVSSATAKNKRTCVFVNDNCKVFVPDVCVCAPGLHANGA